MRKAKGHSGVIAAGDHDNLLVGIPIPALAFEYLMTLSAFPLGLVLQLIGEPGTLKSSLLFEIFRWFRLAGGGAYLYEHESKVSLKLLNSVMDEPHGGLGAVLEPCESVEDWQERLMAWTKRLQKQFMGTKAEPGPGRCIPIVSGVDSLMGKLSEESQSKILASGSGCLLYTSPSPRDRG